MIIKMREKLLVTRIISPANRASVNDGMAVKMSAMGGTLSWAVMFLPNVAFAIGLGGIRNTRYEWFDSRLVIRFLASDVLHV